MKLKKIASLMLAGVMAVSMLAGCSGNGNGGNGGEGEGQVNTDNLSAASVIAELNEDTTEKVTFSADASLENALNKAIATTGSSVGYAAEGFMPQFAALVAEVGEIEVVNAFTFPKAELDHDLDPQTRIWAYVIPSVDLSEKAAVDRFAAAVDQKVTDLEDNRQYFEHSYGTVPGDDTYTKYSYTGNVAVVKVSDVVTGYTGYVGVMTVTCTPAEATLEL